MHKIMIKLLFIIFFLSYRLDSTLHTELQGFAHSTTEPSLTLRPKDTLRYLDSFFSLLLRYPLLVIFYTQSLALFIQSTMGRPTLHYKTRADNPVTLSYISHSAPAIREVFTTISGQNLGFEPQNMPWGDSMPNTFAALPPTSQRRMPPRP